MELYPANLQADFIMDGSPNKLRIMWQFFEKTFLGRDAFEQPREFAVDQQYFDHFNLRVSEVNTGGKGKRGWGGVGVGEPRNMLADACHRTFSYE